MVRQTYPINHEGKIVQHFFSRERLLPFSKMFTGACGLDHVIVVVVVFVVTVDVVVDRLFDDKGPIKWLSVVLARDARSTVSRLVFLYVIVVVVVTGDMHANDFVRIGRFVPRKVDGAI